MHHSVIVGILAAAGLLTGCATPGSQIAAQGKNDLANVVSCCNTLADARNVPLPRKSRVEIDKTRQAFTFDGGKSFFVLYQLPQFSQTYSIVLRSQPGGMMSNASIFLPRVMLLDESFRQTRHFAETGLRSRGDVFERTVFINPANNSERYIAIYGADLAAPLNRVLSVVTTTSSQIFSWSSGADVQATLHPSSVGAFDIETFDLPDEK